MKKLDVEGLGGVISAIVSLPKQFVIGIYLDLRDFKRWSEDRGPRWAALITEKWLGFWYAFLLAHVFGIVGFGMIWIAEQISTNPSLVSTVPWLIFLIATGGIIAIFAYGLAVMGVLIATASRTLFWIRNVSKSYWNNYTPPYDETESDSDVSQWSASINELRTARRNAWKSFIRGTLYFMVFMPGLLWLELNYPDQLYAALGNPTLSSAAEMVNASLWVIDFGILLGSFGLPLSTVQFVGILIMFGLPVVLFTLSARNVLFLCETIARERIYEGAKKEG